MRIKENIKLEILFSSKIIYKILRSTCNSEFRFKKLTLYFNPLSPISDLDIISIYIISMISGRHVMRIKKNITFKSYKSLISLNALIIFAAYIFLAW